MYNLPGYKYSSGIGYITLPTDLDRDTYIRDCYKNFHVSLKTEDGGFLNRVPISPEVLNFCEFPSTTTEIGTCVIFVTDEMLQEYFIVARFANRNEIGDNKEGAFKIRRKIGSQFVEISGSAKEKHLNLIVDGDTDGGEININVLNNNKNGAVNVNIAGDLKLLASGQVSLYQEGTFKVETADNKSDNSATFDQTSTENHFQNQKIVINKGDEPFVLGNKLKDMFDAFIEEVGNITVTTAMGQMPILNKIQILAYKQRTKEFLSQVGYIDK